ncbi:hypothetical protein PM082_006279 [Marasmius tenuissimus]|nr:hypothetical protein PM082_006279 [Marasmius tenuissimus]
MVRPAVHATSHIALDTVRIGPGIIYSQCTMERLIGYLVELIRQHSNAFANLAQQSIRVATVNILKALDPTLQTEMDIPLLPRGAEEVGDGYSLRRAKDTAARPVTEREMAAIRAYLQEQGLTISESFTTNITRWARVGLPNGQIA